MNFEKKMKERIDQNLDKMVKNPYETKKAHKFPFWAKIAIPASTVAVAASVVLAVLLPLANSKTTDAVGRIVTKANVQKIMENPNRDMSTKTLMSYTSFAKKFTKLILENNNKEKEVSLGISIPDAYLCLAVSGVISSQAALNDVLDYLELSSIEELRTAVKEILSALCTLQKDDRGRLNGGFNLNSVWLDPEQVQLLKEKDQELYKDLAEVFDVTTYLEALTSEKANQYLKDNGIKGMPTPQVEIDSPSAVSVMSAFWCLDFFDGGASDAYKMEYQKGNHKMDYTFGDTTKKVDYIGRKSLAPVYEGKDFYGSQIGINKLLMSFYLPNDEKALPSSIMDDVLDEKYQTIYATAEHPVTGESYKTNYMVNISAPYFSLDNNVILEHQVLYGVLPNITTGGAAARLAETKSGMDMYLDSIQQFSVMKFNYDGFYSCSVTIASMVPTSAQLLPNDEFELKLDHPYVFTVEKTVTNNGVPGYRVPIVIGEIVDPNYKD